MTEISIVPEAVGAQAVSSGLGGLGPATIKFVIPTHRTMPMVWIAGMLFTLLTAMLIAIVAAVVTRSRLRTKPLIDESAFREYSNFLNDFGGAGLPAGLTPTWPSSAAVDPPSDMIRAVRIGAEDADLAIASWARNRASLAAYKGDTAAMWYAAFQCGNVAMLAHDLAASFDHVPDGGNSALLLRSNENEANRCATISAYDRTLALTLGLNFYPHYIMLGNWLEATRVAALRRDSAYFRHPKVEAEATFAVSIAGLEPRTHIVLLHLRQFMLHDSTYAFDRIANGSTAALAALTN